MPFGHLTGRIAVALLLAVLGVQGHDRATGEVVTVRNHDPEYGGPVTWRFSSPYARQGETVAVAGEGCTDRTESAGISVYHETQGTYVFRGYYPVTNGAFEGTLTVPTDTIAGMYDVFLSCRRDDVVEHPTGEGRFRVLGPDEAPPTSTTTAPVTTTTTTSVPVTTTVATTTSTTTTAAPTTTVAPTVTTTRASAPPVEVDAGSSRTSLAPLAGVAAVGLAGLTLAGVVLVRRRSH